MTFPEILPHLLAGKPVRCARWNDCAIMVLKNGTLEDRSGNSTRMPFLAVSLGRDDWELYKPIKAIPLSEVKPGEVFGLSDHPGSMKYIKSVGGRAYNVSNYNPHIDQDQKCYPCKEEEL